MKKISILLSVLVVCMSMHAQDVSLVVNASNVQWQISNYLLGLHSVYTNDADAIYADGSIAQWARNANAGVMRYPGGTIVKYWDWENPTGVMKGDPWNPNWDPNDNAPPGQWMSLDEYLDFVDASGITPLFGVNITSGHKYNRVQESVDRAVRMVQYVKNRGYGGAFWYLGNEGGNGGASNEANLFVRHASAMKQADPNIKCMFNHNNLDGNYLKNYLAIAGDYIDIAETHGKWPYGGDPNLAPGTFDEWKVEVPLRDRKNRNRKWRYAANTLRARAAEAGYPNLKIANNEYGVGKSSNVIGFNRYTKGLLMVDMLQEHFIGNWYMTAFWSNVRNTSDEGGLVSPKNNNRFNPMIYGFELLGKAQGGDMLELQKSGNISVYGFAAKKNGEYLLYLINKNESSKTVSLSFSGLQGTPKFVDGNAMVNTSDNWGQMVSASMNSNGSTFTCTLQPLSYSRFTFVTTQGSYSLTTNVSGQGSVSPFGGNYSSGTQVSLSATPASGWQFDNWSGDATGSQNPMTITMNSNKSVTANFSPVSSTQYYYLQAKATNDFLRPENSNEGSYLIFTSSSSGDYVLWEQVSVGGDYYYFKNKATGMQFKPVNSNDFSKYEQRPWTGDWTHFKPVPTSDGVSYYLTNKSTGKYMGPTTGTYAEQKPTSWTGNWTRMKIISQSALKSSKANMQIYESVPIISAFPNPAKEVLYINGLLDELLYELQVYDLTGRRVMNDLIEGNISFELNIDNLQPGIYLLKLQNDTNIQKIRFVKE